MRILHTSGEEMGQVYLPMVNWLLMACVFIVVLSFQSSSALASAYGIAVTGTMIIDTMLAFIVIQSLWKWRTSLSLLFLITFITIDSLFLFANSLKIPTGGWLPLFIGTLLFLIMTTWVKGRTLLTSYMYDNRVLFEELDEKVTGHKVVSVKGTAIYLAKTLHGVPQVFSQNFEHNHVLHEQVIVLTVVTKEEPYVAEENRMKIRKFGARQEFYRIKFYYGFQQNPDVKKDLELCAAAGINIDFEKTSFFIGSEQITFKKQNPLPEWRRILFLFLFRNASSPIGFLKIPAERVIELGTRINL
jgi:KUP system potassium uptake protein